MEQTYYPGSNCEWVLNWQGSICEWKVVDKDLFVSDTEVACVGLPGERQARHRKLQTRRSTAQDLFVSGRSAILKRISPLCSLKSKLGRRHVRGVVRHSHMQAMWPPAMAHGYGQMHRVWQQHLPHLFALCQTCSLCHLPQTCCDVLRSWTWEVPKELQAMARHRRLA